MSWLGFFYAGNIAGAVVGSLLAGFYLLSVYDMRTATLVAVVFNMIVAGLAWSIASRHAVFRRGVRVPPDVPRVRANEDSSSAYLSASVYVAIALSGFCALAGEVIWTRLLGLLFGATVYTFSIILAVFLIGLGIGSTAGSVLAKSVMRPRVALGWCQILVVVAIAWTSRTITQSLPYWPVSPTLTSKVSLEFEFDFVRACGPCCRPRFCGAPAFRSRWRRWRRETRTQVAWSVVSTRRTQSAPSSARCREPAAHRVDRIPARSAGDDGLRGRGGL